MQIIIIILTLLSRLYTSHEYFCRSFLAFLKTGKRMIINDALNQDLKPKSFFRYRFSSGELLLLYFIIIIYFSSVSVPDLNVNFTDQIRFIQN